MGGPAYGATRGGGEDYGAYCAVEGGVESGGAGWEGVGGTGALLGTEGGGIDMNGKVIEMGGAGGEGLCVW